MAFDPGLFDGSGIDPTLFGPYDTEVSDPEEQENIRRQRNDIATKAGYPTWDAYVRAVGENRALDQQQAALQIQKLQVELAKSVTGGVSPTSAAQLAQSAQQFAIRLEEDRAERVERQAQEQTRLAEQQRQFVEQFGAGKARFNIEQQFEDRRLSQSADESQRNRDFQREQTLLQLGSKPDTLIRYLKALRGQTDGAPPLPGASAGALAQVAATPLIESPAAARVAPPIASAALPTNGLPAFATPATPAPTLTPQQVKNYSGITLTGPGANAPTVAPSGQPTGIPQIPLPSTGAGISDAVRRGFTSFTGIPTSQAQNPNPGQPFRLPGDPLPPTPLEGGSSQIFTDERALDLARSALARDDRVDRLNEQADRDIAARFPSRGYGDGGVIPEPVMGVGLISGQTYTLGEKGEEVVVPKDKVPHDIFEKLMHDAEEVDYSEDKTGKRRVKVKRGMNSYANGGPLGYKPIDPKVFNPSSISNEFDFPQIGNLTGGTSLVPSAQRLFGALPSERSLYAGYLNDEAGVQSQDVFEMARRLAPQDSLRAGRFVN